MMVAFAVDGDEILRLKILTAGFGETTTFHSVVSFFNVTMLE